MNCVFCNRELPSIKAKNSLALSFDDKYPIVKGHSLIVPLIHVNSFFDLSSAEQKACFTLLEYTKRLVARKDASVSGLNIGVNDGVDAGQKGDVPDPNGGIRQIIPSKAFYY
jgi:diadenosine tetraphosphate (Ap4A) HIT family hydrolase